MANIAAEEFGHVEPVAATINSLLTGAAPTKGGDPTRRRSAREGVGNPHHFLVGGQGGPAAGLTGPAVERRLRLHSGDLIARPAPQLLPGDRRAEGKLRVYEIDHPVARELSGYLLVRGGVHQVAYARAVERLTGADLSKMFPSPRIPTDKIPECRPHIKRGTTCGSIASRRPISWSSEPSSTARTPRPASRSRSSTKHPRASPPTTCLPETNVFAPGYDPQESRRSRLGPARQRGCRRRRPAWSRTGTGQAREAPVRQEPAGCEERGAFQELGGTYRHGGRRASHQSTSIAAGLAGNR